MTITHFYGNCIQELIGDCGSPSPRVSATILSSHFLKSSTIKGGIRICQERKKKRLLLRGIESICVSQRSCITFFKTRLLRQISRFPITSETSFQQTATIHRSTEVVYDNPKLLQVFRNLASYGNNLNQIAAYLNQGGTMTNPMWKEIKNSNYSAATIISQPSMMSSPASLFRTKPESVSRVMNTSLLVSTVNR